MKTALCASLVALLALAGCGTTSRDWQAALRADTPSSYGGFLSRHPDGVYADSARMRLDSLISGVETVAELMHRLSCYRGEPTSHAMACARRVITKVMRPPRKDESEFLKGFLGHLHMPCEWSIQTDPQSEFIVTDGRVISRNIGYVRNMSLKLKQEDRTILEGPMVLFEGVPYVLKEGSEPGSISEDGILHGIYERLREEVRARHILLNLTPRALPEETTRVYALAADLIRRVQAGEDFSSLADRYSQDSSVARNHGDIYYFTAGQMLQAFEDAAYSLQAGEVGPVPVRTRHGYHVIKVTDRRPAAGSMRASHIMARCTGGNPQDTVAALERIRKARSALEKGTAFHEAAREFSEDDGSASRGGDLGWFERRRWVQPFDEAVFRLTPGEVSGMVRTPFGYHLIRCDSVRALGSFSEMSEKLMKIREAQIAGQNR
ncbi:MAG: peptidylprolyl isomerase [Bacteroidota bacterium]